MAIDTQFFHQVCIDILYGMIALLTFVMLERLIYLALLKRSAMRIDAAAKAGALKLDTKAVSGGNPLARALNDYLQARKAADPTKAALEDYAGALFIDMDHRINARLWVLDTIVTAAPLLGLLGTILGIMDAFNALSSGGVSDPAAVSRGIASALIATAIGIGAALYGLLGHNVLHRLSDHLLDQFKRFIMLIDSGAAGKPASMSSTAATPLNDAAPATT